MSGCAEQRTGPSWPRQAARSELLKDFADIAEIGGIESFSETRVDALQVGDGAGLGLRLRRDTHPARSNPQTP